MRKIKEITLTYLSLYYNQAFIKTIILSFDKNKYKKQC